MFLCRVLLDIHAREVRLCYIYICHRWCVVIVVVFVKSLFTLLSILSVYYLTHKLASFFWWFRGLLKCQMFSHGSFFLIIWHVTWLLLFYKIFFFFLQRILSWILWIFLLDPRVLILNIWICCFPQKPNKKFSIALSCVLCLCVARRNTFWLLWWAVITSLIAGSLQ